MLLDVRESIYLYTCLSIVQASHFQNLSAKSIQSQNISLLHNITLFKNSLRNFASESLKIYYICFIILGVTVVPTMQARRRSTCLAETCLGCQHSARHSDKTVLSAKIN
jgi:hypothetical protein